MLERLAARSAREQIICACVLLVICGYVFYAGMVEPQLTALRATTARLRAARDLLAAKRTASTQHGLDQERLADLRHRLARSEADFLSAGEAAAFFADLHTQAEAAKCQVRAIDFLPMTTSRRSRAAQQIGAYPEGEGAAAASVKPVHLAGGGGGKKGSGLVFATIKAPAISLPTKTTPDPFFPVVARWRARLSLAGTYPHVIQFLQGIRERAGLVAVSEMAFELVSREAPDLNVSLVVSVFSLQEEGSTGK